LVRAAALRAFQRRGTTPEANFYLQMYRIETSKAFELICPIRINSFNEHGEFKQPSAILMRFKEPLQRALCAFSDITSKQVSQRAGPQLFFVL